MELAHVFHLIGALVTAGLGILGLLWPRTAARLVGLEPSGRLGAAAARVGDAFLVGGASRPIWRAALFEAGVAALLLAPV